MLKLKVGLGMIPVQVEVSKEHVACDFFLGKLERRNSNTKIKFEVPTAEHG